MNSNLTNCSSNLQNGMKMTKELNLQDDESIIDSQESELTAKRNATETMVTAKQRLRSPNQLKNSLKMPAKKRVK
jgi:hypothetical protein